MPRRNYFQRTQARQYHGRDRENPYFRHVRKVPWKWLSLTVMTIAAACVLIGFLFSHPALSIQRVEISGLEHIDRDLFETDVRNYLSERALLFFHRSNQFLFSKEALQASLQNHFTFTSLSISQTGKDLHIDVQERTSNLIWTTDQEYIVDLQGVVVRSLNRGDAQDEELASRLPLFYDINEVPVTIGSPVLTEKEIESVFHFHDLLIAQSIPFTATQVNRLVGGWMSIVTSSGYEIYFDVTGDIEAQAESLKTVLSTQIEDPEELEYIDVRFGDHVYFK